jgi:acetyl esterase/lipase
VNWRRFLVLLIGLGACSSGVDPSTTTTPAVSTTNPTTTPTSAPADQYLLESATVDERLPIDIYGPSESGPWPVAVLFHGGGWFGGDRASMVPLARVLAESGVVVFNATYRTSNGGYPESFEDVACAVRYAVARAREFTEDTRAPTVIGHSAGAHLAAVVALDGDKYRGSCSLPGSALPTRFVGLAGPFDVTQFTLVLASYFGTQYADDPAPWDDGSPFTHVGGNPELEVLLVHGSVDELVPVEFTENFGQALEEAGYLVAVEILEGLNHFDTRDPDLVGELIASLISG